MSRAKKTAFEVTGEFDPWQTEEIEKQRENYTGVMDLVFDEQQEGGRRKPSSKQEHPVVPYAMREHHEQFFVKGKTKWSRLPLDYQHTYLQRWLDTVPYIYLPEEGTSLSQYRPKYIAKIQVAEEHIDPALGPIPDLFRVLHIRRAFGDPQMKDVWVPIEPNLFETLSGARRYVRSAVDDHRAYEQSIIVEAMSTRPAHNAFFEDAVGVKSLAGETIHGYSTAYPDTMVGMGRTPTNPMMPKDTVESIEARRAKLLEAAAAAFPDIVAGQLAEPTPQPATPRKQQPQQTVVDWEDDDRF